MFRVPRLASLVVDHAHMAEPTTASPIEASARRTKHFQPRVYLPSFDTPVKSLLQDPPWLQAQEADTQPPACNACSLARRSPSDSSVP